MWSGYSFLLIEMGGIGAYCIWEGWKIRICDFAGKGLMVFSFSLRFDLRGRGVVCVDRWDAKAGGLGMTL